MSALWNMVRLWGLTGNTDWPVLVKTLKERNVFRLGLSLLGLAWADAILVFIALIEV